jgi:hypothetical protein
VEARPYIESLPTTQIREIHFAGIQRFGERWVDRARQAGIDGGLVDSMRGQLVDHLPMVEGDWTFLAWAMERVHSGVWGRPWVVTFEYGGVGPWFEMVTERDVLAEQIPRLHALVRGN